MDINFLSLSKHLGWEELGVESLMLNEWLFPFSYWLFHGSGRLWSFSYGVYTSFIMNVFF
jgi:hypothetical protein